MLHTLVAIGFAAACHAQTPILHYDFDDQANPTANLGSLGAEYDGALGAGIEFIPFDDGHAVDFDSPDDDWIIPGGDEDAFDIADGDFSVTGRFATSFQDPEAKGVRFLVTKQSVGSDDGWSISVHPATGLLYFVMAADGDRFVVIFSDIPVNDGLTHEFACIKSGCSLVIYVDDEPVGADRIPADFGSTAQNPEPLVIGGRSLGNAPPFGGPNDEWVGAIDDLKIYDQAIIDFACAADLNNDCTLDILDFVAFQTEWADQSPLGDCDDNGTYNILDFVCFQSLFQAGCP